MMMYTQAFNCTSGFSQICTVHLLIFGIGWLHFHYKQWLLAPVPLTVTLDALAEGRRTDTQR